MNTNIDNYDGFIDFQIKNKDSFPIIELIEKLSISQTAFFSYKKKPFMFRIQTILELADIYDVNPMFLTNLILMDIDKDT